jgi:hypothetical protein
VRNVVAARVSGVSATTTATGIGNVLGNKGAVTGERLCRFYAIPLRFSFAFLTDYDIC